ncbi:hypothetical protein KJ644_00995, partial [Candidatus Dependentiae bacterium]|nr:hypothetical protein [Candidatus Dependentiae bacterium]
ILSLDRELGYVSNATINNNNLISYNSSAIITGLECCENNSNAIVSLDKKLGYVSNATIQNDKQISWNSNAILQLNNRITNNSNAIITHDRELGYISNATIFNNKQISWNSSAILNLEVGALDQKITNNSNAILSLNLKLNYVSSATIENDFQISWNSSAIIQLNNRITNNSNAILNINDNISYISSATINNNNLISYNSSAIITGINNNSNAILSLDRELGYVSNATVENNTQISWNSSAILINNKNIHYNSQAILTSLNTTGLQAQIDANKLGIRYNSNAILTNLNNQQDTILTQGPITTDITLRDSIFVHTNQRIFIDGNVTIDGNGAVIIFSNPNHSQFVVSKGKTVTLKNIQFLRINQKTFDLRFALRFDNTKPTKYAIDDSHIIIGENVLFGLSENITMSQGLIEITNNTNNETQIFSLKGIEGQKQFRIAPTEQYSDALSKADNGLSWLQRKSGIVSKLASIYSDRFTQNGTVPVLLKCNDNTLGLQSINLSGFEHVSKSDSANYQGTISLFGNSDIDIGDESFTEFEKNKNIQESYNMIFVIQNIGNNLRLLKDDIKFTGKLQFADFGENELCIDSAISEPITPKLGSNDPLRLISQVNFGTDFVQLKSTYGLAKLIFNDKAIRINNDNNGFNIYENSYIYGKTIEVSGSPISNAYNPTSLGNQPILDIEKLIGMDDINNKPIKSNYFLYFDDKNLELKTAVNLTYEKELNNILNN